MTDAPKPTAGSLSDLVSLLPHMTAEQVNGAIALSRLLTVMLEQGQRNPVLLARLPARPLLGAIPPESFEAVQLIHQIWYTRRLQIEDEERNQTRGTPTQAEELVNLDTTGVVLPTDDTQGHGGNSGGREHH